jgi:hypothetical protein
VTVQEDDAPPPPPPLSITITGPTAAATYTSVTDTRDVSGTATDSVGVTEVTLRNNRDIEGYLCTGTASWQFNGQPLYQGTNYVDAKAYTARGASATDTVEITYTGDIHYDDVLRSGAIVQQITFPDNLTPGQTNTVQWQVLSYVPILSRVYASGPGVWTNFQNGTYKATTESPWNLYGRHANVYSFECAWPVPQESGDFNVWFNVAQMDGDQFMIPVIPDGVDARRNPAYPNVIERTIGAGGNGVAPQSAPDNWDSPRIFETVDQHKERSAATVTAVTLADNLRQGTRVTCQWTVQSYLDVKAQLLVLNLAQKQVWLTVDATQVGTPTNTTYKFQDRVNSTWYYAQRTTFQATFTVPNQPGDQQIYFRCQDSANTNSSWMAGNLAAEVDARPVLENGMYGRLIERTIKP